MKRNVMIAREINKLKEKLLFIGGKVEENFYRAVQAIENRDVEMAQLAIDTDDEIDRLEVELEEECLKVLALHQPVAGDLRFIITVLKVNNDLERIDDKSVHLAKHALFLATQPITKFPFDFSKMFSLTRTMLKDSLDSLVETSQIKALRVRETDDKVDDLNRQMYKNVHNEVVADPDNIDMYIHFMGISRCFERIADLSTNIAEDVIYFISGEIVRH